MMESPVIPRTPLRHSSTFSGASSSSPTTTDDEAGSSGFSWSSTSETASSFSTSPATSAFSTSPGSCRSLTYGGKAYNARRRASTSASNTLETFARLNTLPEHDAESILAGIGSEVLHAEPATFGEGSPSAAHSFPLQSAATISIPMPSIDDAQPVQPRTPPTPAEIHEAVVAEQGTSRGLAIANAGIESSQEESELSPSASAPSGRPELRTRLSKKLFLKGRERASSLSKLPFVRPKLDRRSAASGSTTPGTPTGDTDDNSPYSPAEANPRRRVLERLQDRFARSAPSSPALTPSASTDRVHLFRSRPSSIVVSGRGVEFNYFTGHLRDVSSSQPSSCDASVYQPALDRIGQWGSTDELVNSASAEIFEDALPKNLFDALLPREVKLKVFSLVVEGCIEEEELITQERSWTASRAARERWIGERAGLRELVKMSRVCREWRDLVFDGQLWQNIHISRTFGCDVFLSSGLVRLASHAGSFLRRLDLRGFSQLQDWDLDDITESCKNHTGFTSLTYIDLSGCSSISTKPLHGLLVASPDLTHLNVRGLTAVMSSTCYAALACGPSRLKHLDASLCRNLTGASLLEMNQPELEHLCATKIPSLGSEVVGSLPRYFPKLRYLDIGYLRYLTDEAFSKWPKNEEGGMLLQGLRLSGCHRLTDQTCINLVGKLPHLETLELASIGGTMRDAGLAQLIEASPKLRKLDLEDAMNLTDRILSALTPPKHGRGPPSLLEHLNVTNVPELTEAALVRLVRACPSIRIIEASNCFNISDTFIKAFAHHVKKHHIKGSEIAIVDCRSVARQALKDQASVTRPRRGVRDYSSRHFGYIEADGRGRGLAECDENRIVVHSFWTWQQVDDAEGAARSLRTAKLAREVASGSNAYSYPFTLRARRSSYGTRGGNDGIERTGGSCIIS